jgi:hypothetical protein
VRDYSKGIMQAEPFAKVLCCFKLTGPIREERDLRECFPCKRENGLCSGVGLMFSSIQAMNMVGLIHSGRSGDVPADQIPECLILGGIITSAGPHKPSY